MQSQVVYGLDGQRCLGGGLLRSGVGVGGYMHMAVEKPRHKGAAVKIQRSDISILPRRFWSLANNSFLLHDYHNYNHLLLAEEAGRLWLGVPGIYDPREARAADLFGFPQFTREYAAQLDLEPEERSDSDDFGYWCRCVGTGRIE